MARRGGLTRAVQTFGTAAIVTVGLVAAGLALRTAARRLQHERDTELHALARRVADLVARTVAERRHEVELLATIPELARLADSAGTLGAPADQRTMLLAGSRARLYLALLASRSSFNDLAIADRAGRIALAAALPEALDQSGASWWRTVRTGGSHVGAPLVDSVRGTVALEFSAAVEVPGRPAPVGVLRVEYPVERLGFVLRDHLGRDSASAVHLVDQQRRILVSSRSASEVARLFTDTAALATAYEAGAVRATEAERVAAVRIPQLGWTVVARRAERGLLGSLPAFDAVILADGVVFGLAAALVLGLLTSALKGRVVIPLSQLERVADEVARGRLAHARIPEVRHGDEIGRLTASVGTMVEALRRLVSAIRGASGEAVGMAADISATTDDMTAATQEVAARTSDLTTRTHARAEVARAAASGAAEILAIAHDLAEGAEVAATRSTELARVAREERSRLDGSAQELARLAGEVRLGAADADALADASAAIERFVTETRQIADQTHLLSFNASIEAARAGEFGRGFTVVAEEIRRLALEAQRAADETAATVHRVQERVRVARERLLALGRSGEAVREAADATATGLHAVARRAEENDAWSRRILESAAAVRNLVAEIGRAIQQVSSETNDDAAAAVQIAAAAHQLAAATEAISASAHAMSGAAERLASSVSAFELGTEPAPPSVEAEPVGPRLVTDPPAKVA